jgi:hypothetical protein
MTRPPPRVVVAISYFRDGSVYPRSGPRDRQGDVYWANIAVSGATLRHVAGPDVELVVFAGDEPPADAASLLQAAGAEIRALPFARRPPDDFSERYVGSLYVLDTMAALATELADDDVVLFADPDVVWARSPGPLVDEVRRGGVVAYDLGVPDTVPMCDLTRRQQGEILGEMTGEGPAGSAGAYTHFGGELYGLLGVELRSVVPELDRLWDATLHRYRAGLPRYTVEEHLLNAVLWARGEQTGRANPHLQRVRTLPAPFGTRKRVTPELVAWHLPMEKDKGFLRVFRHLAAGRSLPPPGPGYQRWLRRQMGVAPAGRRWVADRARQVKWAATGRSRGGTPNHGL